MPASSIGGIYDALIAAQPGAFAGSSATRTSGMSARLPTTGDVARVHRSAKAARAHLLDCRPRIDPSAQVDALDRVGRCRDRRLMPCVDACIVTDGASFLPAPATTSDYHRCRRCAFMTDQRNTDHIDLPRADRPLPAARAALPPRAARVVPLTGDASDRKYFRIIHADGRRSCWRCTPAPIDFATLPFANVADCCIACRCRCRQSSATPTRSASSRSRISATSRCRRTSARRRRPSTPPSIARRSRSSSCCSAAAPSWRRTAICRTGSRSTSRSSPGSSTSS